MSWNGSWHFNRKGKQSREARNEERPRKKTGRVSCCIGAILLVVAMGASMWLRKRPAKVIEQTPKCETRIRSTKIVESSAPTVRRTRETKAEKTKKPEKPNVKILGTTPTGEQYVEVEASTNATGVVERLYTLADGSKKRIVILQSKDTLVFDNDFDLMLALIGTTPLDQKLPPLPDLGDMEEQFKKAMESPILVREGDSEQTKKMKEAALALRLEINELMREGYTVTQILSEYESLRDCNVRERRAFQAELNEIYRSGDIEGAREYLKSANEKLERFGIIPLTMPGEE